MKEESDKKSAILPSMKPVFASLRDADGLANVNKSKRTSVQHPPASSGEGADKEFTQNGKHLASKIITVSTIQVAEKEKGAQEQPMYASFGRKQNVIKPVLKNSFSTANGIEKAPVRSALKDDSPLIKKSKKEVKMKSNLRQGADRASYKVLGFEK